MTIRSPGWLRKLSVSIELAPRCYWIISDTIWAKSRRVKCRSCRWRASMSNGTLPLRGYLVLVFAFPSFIIKRVPRSAPIYILYFITLIFNKWLLWQRLPCHTDLACLTDPALVSNPLLAPPSSLIWWTSFVCILFLVRHQAKVLIVSNSWRNPPLRPLPLRHIRLAQHMFSKHSMETIVRRWIYVSLFTACLLARSYIFLPTVILFWLSQIQGSMW